MRNTQEEVLDKQRADTYNRIMNDTLRRDEIHDEITTRVFFSPCHASTVLKCSFKKRKEGMGFDSSMDC